MDDYLKLLLRLKSSLLQTDGVTLNYSPQAFFQEMDIDNNQHLSHRDFYNFLSRHNCTQVTDNHLFDYFDSNAQGSLPLLSV